MEEYYFDVPISNSKSLCIGTLTRSEAASAREEHDVVDGFGYYLFIADVDPNTLPRVLAKLVNEDAASDLVRLISRRQIAPEPA